MFARIIDSLLAPGGPIDQGFYLIKIGVVLDILDKTAGLLESVDGRRLLVAVAQNCSYEAVGKKFADNWEWLQRSAAVDVDRNVISLTDRVCILVCLAREGI